MNPTLKAVLFTLAFICFVIAMFMGVPAVHRGRESRPLLGGFTGWLAAGLGFWVFPFVWDAWEVT